MYDQGRYFVMTGIHMGSTSILINERLKEIKSPYAQYLAEPEVVSQASVAPQMPLPLGDVELLDKARNASNVDW